MLNPVAYESRYVSEIRQETDGSFDDCVSSSLAMFGDDATLGEFSLNAKWDRIPAPEFREMLREGAPVPQSGGLTLNHANTMIQSWRPELPSLPRWDDGSLVLTFNEMWDRLLGGDAVAMLFGNPIHCPVGSRLRAPQGNDNYKHCIVVSRTRKDEGLVKDPLWRKGPSFGGEWVPKEEIRDFAREYLREKDKSVRCAVVNRGEWSRAELNNRRALDRVARLEAEVMEVKAKLVTVRAARDEAVASLQACRAGVDYSGAWNGALDAATTALASLRKVTP